MDNKTAGAQLVKNLSFEVEAIPQDNSIEIKNSEKMTPLNVKVRVRKKENGPSIVRKGFIAVERIDQPDSPIERLRLASSDQTIMSFNMLMEADLEKRVVKKTKKNFFGICLGVRGDDDDFQYLPTTSDIDNDTMSDTKMVKLKNVRLITKPVVADDSSSSYYSRKKDKFFGKCKPGGCLDPPFGEDRYTYQPQPRRLKSPATRINDTQEVGLQEKLDITTGQTTSKKKGVEVINAADETEQDEKKSNKSNPILSLYQGEPKTEVEDIDSEYLITYPPALSSSGLLSADEKNVTRRTSGVRPSRKSFNEFATEYFSPPRTPRDSKDSSRSEKGKYIATKEILGPNRRNIDETDSKNRGILEKGDANFKLNPNEKTHDISGDSSMRDEAHIQKSALKSTLRTRNSDLLKDDGNEPNKKPWDQNGLEATALGEVRQGDEAYRDGSEQGTDAAKLAGLGAITAGVVGLGFANARKNVDTGNSENTATNETKFSDTDSKIGLSQALESYGTKDDLASRGKGIMGYSNSGHLIYDNTENKEFADNIASQRSFSYTGNGTAKTHGTEDALASTGNSLTESSEKKSSPMRTSIFKGTDNDTTFRETEGERFSTHNSSPKTYSDFASRETLTEGSRRSSILISPETKKSFPVTSTLSGSEISTSKEMRMTDSFAGGVRKALNDVTEGGLGRDSNLAFTEKSASEVMGADLSLNGKNDILESNGKEKDFERHLKPRQGAENSDIEYPALETRYDSVSENNGNDKTQPKMLDASAVSNIIKSPSDIISEYRENKNLDKSPVVGIDIQPIKDILYKAGRRLDDWGNYEQSASAVGITSYSYENIDTAADNYMDRDKYDYETQSDSGYTKRGTGRTKDINVQQSKDSIFLNLAFQTNLDENQTTVTTLDSSKNHELGEVILVKSLVRPQDKKGVSVPINDKYMMNIEIKSVPVYDRKSKFLKPITKFDSGKSSGSAVSLKDIGSDPHAALSVVFKQELIPLRSVIKSLKGDIDALAAQQNMLRDRLERPLQRTKPTYNKKCGCLLRVSSIRTE